MGRARDLSKEKFGRLQPIHPMPERKNGSIIWHCKCDCGNEKDIPAYYLTGGGTNSCGCLKKETDKMPKGNIINEIGNKYSHLTVVARAGSDKNGQAIWECECDCGNSNHIFVLGGNLRKGHTTSCGCERMSHGEQAVSKILRENNIPFESEKILFKYSNGVNARFDFYIND